MPCFIEHWAEWFFVLCSKALMLLMDMFCLYKMELQVGVYRMSNERIGCSLADAAATPHYMNYLETASNLLPSLHVVYINTSLETKAYSHELVPTITCTSSNVVPTILQVGCVSNVVCFSPPLLFNGFVLKASLLNPLLLVSSGFCSSSRLKHMVWTWFLHGCEY